MADIKHGLSVLKKNIKIAPEKPGVYRMLGEGDCLDRQIRAAEKRVERIHTSLLEGVGDDRLRTEVRRLLESGR